jgi:hypothetical protein
MSDLTPQPSSSDAILGGSNPPSVTAAVLGGLEGAKKCLESQDSFYSIPFKFKLATSEAEKVRLLKLALSYCEELQHWLWDIVACEKGKVQWIAAALISETSNKIYKETLVDYFANCLKDSRDNWNSWKQEVPEVRLYLKSLKFNNKVMSLRGVDFSKSNLINADFSYIDLNGANLSDTILYHAKFCHADLEYCDLSRAKLVEANLYLARLYSANLFGVDLRKANLDYADLKYAQLESIVLGNTSLALSGVRGRM